MAKSPAHTISDFLSDNGLGSTSASTTWQIRTGRQGETPDSHITVYDSGGQSANAAYRINYPNIQVRVRGGRDDYPAAYAKINDIVEFLNGLQPQDIAGDRWSGVTVMGGINFIGYDAESRPEFTVNFRCIVEPAANSSTFMHRNSL
jgi:hypothetical protein